MAKYIRVGEGEGVNYFNMDHVTAVAFHDGGIGIRTMDDKHYHFKGDVRIIEESDFLMELFTLSTQNKEEGKA